MIISKLCTKLESDCIKSVQRYGFDVDKEELAKALNYDRKQYEKGYMDGYNKAIDDFAEKLKSECRIHYVDCDPYFGGITDSILYKDDIEEIAEQLKEGGNINEQS